MSSWDDVVSNLHVWKKGEQCAVHKPLLFLLLLFSPLAAGAAESGIYEGTIGPGLQVVVALELHGDQVSGRYCYVGHGGDLSLNGVLKGDALILTEADENSVPTGEWMLQATGKDALGGSWQSPDKKKKLKVTIRLIEHDTARYDEIKQRQAGRTEVVDPATVSSAGRTKVALVRARPKAKVRYPKIIESANSKSRAALNRRLKSDYGSEEICAGIEVETSLRLLGERFLEVESYSTGYCQGAAYPLNHEGGRMVFDIDGAKEVRFEDLFMSYDDNQEVIQNLFKRAVNVKTSLSLASLSACQETEANVSLEFSVDAATKSVLAYRNFPHAAAICNALPPRTAAFKDLKPFLSDVGRSITGTSTTVTDP